MADKPILFNTQMVKAILDGSKTQTRRLIKPQPPCVLKKMTEGHHTGEWHLYRDSPMMNPMINSPWGAQFLPPYKPDDILWVRETWNGGRLFGQKGNGYVYAADYKEQSAFGWRPSIHMPKEAARLFLLVKNVRCERLQDISHDDVLHEGIIECEGRKYGEDCDCVIVTFAELWDSTIKKADLARYGWDANPWVWVIEFERLDGVAGDIKER